MGTSDPLARSSPLPAGLDLAGKSVLVVGPAAAAAPVAEEARRRGAACAVEPGLLGPGDLLARPPLPRADVNVCPGPLERLPDPIEAVRSLAAAARELLVLDLVGPDAPLVLRRLRKLRVRRAVRANLPRLPVIFVGRNRSQASHEDRFYLTPAALERILMEQRRDFARLHVERGREGRYRVTAWKRRIGSLSILAGPSCSGKKHLTRELAAGRAPDVRPAVDVGGDFAPFVSVHELDTLAGPRVERVYYHYDILRPWKRGADFGLDEALDVIGCADLVRTTSLWAEPEALVARLDERIRRCRERGRDRKVKELERRRALYTEDRGARLRSIFREWLDFCERRGLETAIVDATLEPRPISRAEWEGRG